MYRKLQYGKMMEKLQHFRKLFNGKEKYIHIEIIFIFCAMVKFKYTVLSRLNIMILVHEVLISDLDKVTTS